MNKKSQFEELIWRYFENRASDHDVQALSQWLDESKENLKRFAAIKKAYIELEVCAGGGAERTAPAFNKFLSSIERVENNRTIEKSNKILYMRKSFYRYAGIILISLLLGIVGYYLASHFLHSGNTNYCEIDVPYGGKSTLVLPDGSKIWLNAGSKLKYDRDFGVDKREVFIEGEAFFNVQKYKYPFVVHTSHFDIHVVGTTFNVKSYPEEENIETTLVEGNIRIESKVTPGQLFLKPNQKLTYHKPSSTMEQSDIMTDNREAAEVSPEEPMRMKETTKPPIDIETNVDVEETTSWKDGKLIINNEPLGELAKVLERKYDIVFRFEEESLKEYSYSGTLLDFPLEQVLKALKLTSPVSYRIEEKIVYLSPNKNFKPSNK